MDSPVVNRTFFAETLRCMYHIYGHDALMKEIQFIHHLYSPTTPSVPAPPAPVPAAPPAPATIVSSESESSSTTNVIVQKLDDDKKGRNFHVKPKHGRSERPHELRCTAITNSGERCSFSRRLPTAFCHRHRDAMVQEEANSEAGSDS
jgi:hypothetical protein